MNAITRSMALAALVVAAVSARADEWPRFRGPDGSGVGTQSGLPTEWSETKNVRWKTPIDGLAWSSPIVCGDAVFVTTAVPDDGQEEPKKGLYFGGNREKPRDAVYRWELWRIDAGDGSVVWKKVVAKRKPTTAIHLKNTYASETPVTDGERVYVYFGAVGVYCHDLDGELVWSREIGAHETRYGWGTSSSPVLDGDRLFIQCDNEDQSFVVALDKRTGEILWRTDRDEGSSWSSPFVWKNDERTELITCATRRVRSQDPATGKLLWELGGMSSIVCPTPIVAHGLLYVSSGYVLDKRKPVFAIRPGGEGDITPADEQTPGEAFAWIGRGIGPYNPSPIVYGDYLYVLYDRGFFACFDARTGKEVYSRKRLGRGGAFTSSPWAYGDTIFCLNEDGDALALKAGPEFEVLRTNSVGEMCMATPAIAGQSLFVRGERHLFCIANAK